MGHYLSELDPEWASNRPKVVSEDVETLIKDFYRTENPGTGTPCPICGSSIEWNWVDAENLVRHVEWHETLRVCINRGYVYSGDKI